MGAVMHALTYSFSEAATSLLRGWKSAAVAVLTIAAGLFVLGFFLIVNANLRNVVSRWARVCRAAPWFPSRATRRAAAAG